MGGLADRRTGRPGAEFRTVPVALAFGADGGTDTAFAALTEYRRATRRPHPDPERLPVIFNDYMNCLMGDPTGRPPSSGPCFPLTRPR
jgi:alpha-galactosidase